MKNWGKLFTLLIIFVGFTLSADKAYSNSAERQYAGGSATYVLYFLSHDGMKLESEVRQEATNHHPARTAMELLLAGPHSPKLQKILPEQLIIRDVSVRAGIAYVDIEQEIQNSGLGGSTFEILIVSSIIYTLTELPEIKSVQILVDGRKTVSLFGHLDISEPLKRSDF